MANEDDEEYKALSEEIRRLTGCEADSGAMAAAALQEEGVDSGFQERAAEFSRIAGCDNNGGAVAAALLYEVPEEFAETVETVRELTGCYGYGACIAAALLLAEEIVVTEEQAQERALAKSQSKVAAAQDRAAEISALLEKTKADMAARSKELEQDVKDAEAAHTEALANAEAQEATLAKARAGSGEPAPEDGAPEAPTSEDDAALTVDDAASSPDLLLGEAEAGASEE